MTPNDYGNSHPSNWCALDLAVACNLDIADCEYLYNRLDDDEWAEYCQDHARSQGILKP